MTPLTETQADKKSDIDLRAYDSNEKLSMLLAFATYLSQINSQNLDKVLALCKSYRQFTAAETFMAALLRLHPEYPTAMQTLKEAAAKKFHILVLVDLGGTLFFRTMPCKMGRRNDFYLRKKQYYWRPGARKFLAKLSRHPRVQLCFYSSIMRHNIVPVMLALLQDKEYQLHLFKFHLFDRDYCQAMSSLGYYAPLQEDEFDTYRDLNSVFNDPFARERGFTEKNTILVDSESSKV